MSSEFARPDSASPGERRGGPSDVFEYNLARLVAPALASELRQSRRDRARHKPSRSGPEVLELAGCPLCSTIDPVREAETWVEAQDIEGVELIVCFGLGNAYHLEAVRARYTIPVVFFEPSREVIRAALDHRPLPHEGIRIFDDPARLSRWLSRRIGPQQHIGIVSWPPSRRLFPRLCELTRAAVAEAIRLARLNVGTLQTRLRVWVEHLLGNLPSVVGRRPAPRLRDWLNGRPVILVAAGPSLAKNVHQLKSVAGRAAIVAVNTSLGALERAGVRADLVVAVEALDVSSQLEGLVLNRGCPRVVSMTANAALHRQTEGPVYPFLEALSHFEALGQAAGLTPALPLGGSVANAAFSLAYVLGARRIILVGQDLAYSDGRAYAPGTVFEQIRVDVHGEVAALSNLADKRRIATSRPEIDTTRSTEPVRWVTGWAGDRVCSTPAFDYFRAVFEDWADQLRDAVLINATEGGARIDGFEQRPLADVVAELPAAAAGRLPEDEPIEQNRVLEALRQERVLVERALVAAEALAARPAEGGAAQLSETVGASGLLHACCWATLLNALNDSGTDMRSLSRAVACDAAWLLDRIDAAVQKTAQAEPG